MFREAYIMSSAYTAMQNVDIKGFLKLSENEVSPFLANLVRMSLLPMPAEILTHHIYEQRKEIVYILNRFDSANILVKHCGIDFLTLEQDVKKEQQLRQKLGNSKKDSVLLENVQDVTTEFERCDSTRRIRFVLSEILFVQSQLYELQNQCSTDFIIKESELFDHVVYVDELSYMLTIAIEELPSLVNITDIAEILLHIENGPRIICNIVANKPCSFMEVATHLISFGDRLDEDSVGTRRRMSALAALCHMNPSQALSVRAKCVDLCRMASLTIWLSVRDNSEDGDMVPFLSGLLLGYDQSTRNWFSQFIRTSQKRKGESANAVQLLREDLLRRLKNIVAQAVDSHLPETVVRHATSLLRLYCSLRSIAGIKFGEEELTLLVKLVTSKPPPSPVGVRFVSLGLCMLIACPSLLSQSNLETKGVEWVQWLLKEEVYFESASGLNASFGEMLLLMAIHFHSNQLSAICELVCATLGMKVPLRPNNMTRLKQIFTQDIFTEQVVASHAVKVPVTANLNGNISGYLPIHCIYQLLKSRVFTKHKVSIKQWIYRQICNSTAPVHPVLPNLIEAYINSIIIPNAKANSDHTHVPITEEEIRRIFQNSVFGAHFNVKKNNGLGMDKDIDNVGLNKPTLASQLLLLYYLLLYEDIRLSNTVNNIATGRNVKSYSTEFLAELPIKYLLLKAEKGQALYACLFAPLLKLATTHFPHLSLVEDWFQDASYFPTKINKNIIITENIIKEAFENLDTNPYIMIKVLQKLLLKDPTDIWAFSEIFIKHIKCILPHNVPRKIQELYKDIWMQLNTVLPRTLWVMTVNALQNENATAKDVSLTQENILVDPLQVLRCDTQVFRCAPVLQIVLRMLHSSLAASRIQLIRHVLNKPLTEKGIQLTNEAEREELRMALVASQESLAVQVLLEACLENNDDTGIPGYKWALREVRSLICSHLHQVFIADPSLVKLIHFQGYPRQLLSMTIRGIPSMHICLDFVPELLSQPCMHKQIFAVDLISHLSLQYALPKTMSIARLCVNTLSTLLGAISSDTTTRLFSSVLPSFIRICEAFPPLVDDIISLLMQLGQIVNSLASIEKISGVHPHNTCSPLSRIQSQSGIPSDELSTEIENTVTVIFKKALLKHTIMSTTESTIPATNESMKCVLQHDAFYSKKPNSEEVGNKCYDNSEIFENTKSYNFTVNICNGHVALQSIFELTGLFNENSNQNKEVSDELYDVMKFCDSELKEKLSNDAINNFDILPPELVD